MLAVVGVCDGGIISLIVSACRLDRNDHSKRNIWNRAVAGINELHPTSNLVSAKKPRRNSGFPWNDDSFSCCVACLDLFGFLLLLLLDEIDFFFFFG